MVSRVALVGVLAALTACGVPGAEPDRAEVLARTCASTIARHGLPAPDPAELDPARFVAERERLLASGRRFNTVTPYRNVCAAVRDRIEAATTTTPGTP